MEICIDIEALSTEKNAHILSIAAVAFDVHTDLDTRPLDSSANVFEVAVDSKNQKNRHVDVSTVEWWIQQSQVAQYSLHISHDRVSLRDALKDLGGFIGINVKAVNIWANSPSFDCDILSDAYSQISRIDRPWKFYQERDVRTAKQLVGEPDFIGIKHCALDDALHEARIVQRYLKLKELL